MNSDQGRVPPALGTVAAGQLRRADAEEPSLLDLLNALLIHRRLMILLPLTLVTIVAAFSLTRPRSYTSSAAFIPQQANGSSSLADAAAKFGFAIASSEQGESPAFYSELLRSRSILGSAVDSSYSIIVAERPKSVTLVDVLGREDLALMARRRSAVAALKRSIEVTSMRETGMIELSVSTKDAELSRQVTAMLLALVHQFNLERRQHHAAAERKFVEDRLQQARGELAVAEGRLQRFQETNRRVESSELQLQQNRLNHDLLLRQQIVTSLAEAYERARIDEVRNIPLITVIDEPEAAAAPDGRGTVIRSLLAALIGLGIATAIAITRTSMTSAGHSGRADARLFQQLRNEAIQDVKRPFGRIVGTFRSRRAPFGAGNGSMLRNVPEEDNES